MSSAGQKPNQGSQFGTALYLAYYELHDLSWDAEPQVLFKDREIGQEILLGRGTYVVPEMALPPETKHRAGGAEMHIGRVGMTTQLDEEKTHLVVSIGTHSADFQETRRASQKADLIAGLVGLVLQQGFPLKKVAEYSRPRIGSKGAWSFQSTTRIAGPATFARSDVKVLERGFNNLLDRNEPKIQLALRWYEISKGLPEASDRYLALWTALESLAGGSGTGIVSRIEHLVEEARCSLP